MSRNPLVPRQVGLEPHVDRIVAGLADKETGGQMSSMIRKLVAEALKTRGAI